MVVIKVMINELNSVVCTVGALQYPRWGSFVTKPLKAFQVQYTRHFKLPHVSTLFAKFSIV